MSSDAAGLKPPIVAVLGSINMDLVVRCQSLPVGGQTLAADSAHEVCGGKGANQAVAAAKVGGDVRMIGRVGDDLFAQRLLANLQDQQVNCDAVSPTRNCASGLAIVVVEASGQNSIMLVAGANAKVSVADVERFRHLIESADVLLLQLEIPTDSVLAAIQIASSAGVRCILDPAPVASCWTDELLQVDFICPNETEASAITGLPVRSVEEAVTAAKQLQLRGAKNVAITLGECGSILLAGNASHHIEATAIEAVDTTAAGDAYTGAFAVRWAETDDILEAVRFASVAGAIAATRHGAQPSIGTRKEIETRRSQL
ncbi:MAG: ribokinase [Aureliella sp.]